MFTHSIKISSFCCFLFGCFSLFWRAVGAYFSDIEFVDEFVFYGDAIRLSIPFAMFMEIFFCQSLLFHQNQTQYGSLGFFSQSIKECKD